MKRTLKLALSLTLSCVLLIFAGGALAEPVTLEMWHHMNPAQSEAFVEQVHIFNESQDELFVELTHVPFAELKKQVSINAAADSLPDIFLCDSCDTAAFGEMGIAQDVTEKMEAWDRKDSFYEGPWQSTIYDGRHYGIPLNATCTGIIYNKDMFDAYGVDYPTNDWTWDDLYNISKEMTRDDTLGFAMCLFKSEEGTFHIMPFVWQAGADYDSLGSPEGIEAIEMINKLYAESLMSPDCISLTQTDLTRQLFATGKVAMAVVPNSLVKVAQEDAPDMNIGAVIMPGKENHASCLGGGNIVISSTDHIEEAWSFVEYLHQDEVMKPFLEGAGYIPARQDIAEKGGNWADSEQLSVFMESLTHARPRGPHPNWPEISVLIQEATHDALAGTKTPEEAFTDAGNAVDALIK